MTGTCRRSSAWRRWGGRWAQAAPTRVLVGSWVGVLSVSLVSTRVSYSRPRTEFVFLHHANPSLSVPLSVCLYLLRSGAHRTRSPFVRPVSTSTLPFYETCRAVFVIFLPSVVPPNVQLGAVSAIRSIPWRVCGVPRVAVPVRVSAHLHAGAGRRRLSGLPGDYPKVRQQSGRFENRSFVLCVEQGCLLGRSSLCLGSSHTLLAAGHRLHTRSCFSAGDCTSHTSCFFFVSVALGCNLASPPV